MRFLKSLGAQPVCSRENRQRALSSWVKFSHIRAVGAVSPASAALTSAKIPERFRQQLLPRERYIGSLALGEIRLSQALPPPPFVVVFCPIRAGHLALFRELAISVGSMALRGVPKAAKARDGGKV
jgi:hypothetical protein